MRVVIAEDSVLMREGLARVLTDVVDSQLEARLLELAAAASQGVPA